MLQFRFSCSDPQQWMAEQFAYGLRDKRRQGRLIDVATAFALQPGVSVPQAFARRCDVKGAYRLFDNPHAKPDAVQACHRQRTLGEARKVGTTTLFLEDTTDVSFSGRAPIAGMGAIGSGAKGLQGFQVHSLLATRWREGAEPRADGKRGPVEVMGFAQQVYRLRPKRPKGESRRDARKRLKRPRASQIWAEQTVALGRAPEGVRWVRVCDREADIHEFLVSCREYGHGFVVRAARDRRLQDDAGAPAGQLFATLKAAPTLARFDLLLRGRKGQKQRWARLSVAAAPVVLSPPRDRSYGPMRLPPVQAWGVRVFEADPPVGVEPLEWFLLTDAPVQTSDAACDVALQYSTRWLIEEFHKALKTGLRVEDLQLETVERLYAAMAMMTVVALRLIDLREFVRACPDAPAQDSGLTDLELKVLSARLDRTLHTVSDVALALGRLGGHMNRKSDGMPGWITLWRGARRLQLLVEGVRLATTLDDDA